MPCVCFGARLLNGLQERPSVRGVRSCEGCQGSVFLEVLFAPLSVAVAAVYLSCRTGTCLGGFDLVVSRFGNAIRAGLQVVALVRKCLEHVRVALLVRVQIPHVESAGGLVAP